MRSPTACTSNAPMSGCVRATPHGSFGLRGSVLPMSTVGEVDMARALVDRDPPGAEGVDGPGGLVHGLGREAANGGYVLTVKCGELLITKKIAIIR